MTAVALLSFSNLLPGWVLAAWFGIVVLGPLLLLLVASFRRLGKTRKVTELSPMPPAMLSPDLARCGQPWIGRLGYLGHQMIQILHPAGDDAPDTATWVLPSSKDRSLALLTGTIPPSGGKPGFALRLMTFLADGRVIVTADHPVTHRIPGHWALLQRSFRTIEEQLQVHRERVEELRAGMAAILPAAAEIASRLATEERAINEALLTYGDYRTSGETEIRPSLLHAPAMVLRDLFTRLAGLHALSTTKKDIASARKDSTPGEDELSSGGGFKISLEDQIEQDIRRYRKHADQPLAKKYKRRRAALLLITLVAFTAAFGHDHPQETVAMLLGLIAVHEFGHWLMMKIFGYQRMGRFFVPFVGPIDQGSKPHAPAWQQLAVILAGPLPGLVFGLGVTIASFFTADLPMWLRDLGGLALALNAFQLLPFLPLDGGKAVDLLIFRDLPILRPFFTIVSALATFAAGLMVKSRALKVLAITMFSGLAWDFKMIKVVRGGRRLGWAGTVDDDKEALEKIFRGVREENNDSFLRGGDWQRQIDVLLGEVLRKRAGFVLRIFGGAFYSWSLVIPLLLIVFLFTGKFIGSAGQLNRLAKDVVEFREGFPVEQRAVTQVQYDAVTGLAGLTDDAVASGMGTPRELATLLPAEVTTELDKLDWTAASITLHGGELEPATLSIWLESLCARMETATKNGQHAEALRRAEILLHGLNALEPASLLSEREPMWDAQLRVLTAVDQLAASGKLDAATIQRLDARVKALNKAPVPAVESLLLVDSWGRRQAETALVAPKPADGPEPEFDTRFWRLATPQSRNLFNNIVAFKDATPATVLLGRYWKKSGKVGELPPEFEGGVKVHPAPGEAEYIAAFCDHHRQIALRRMTTLSALAMETYRLKNGAFPKQWKYAIPGGAELSLDNTSSPCLKLIDHLKEVRKPYPAWLGPLKDPATVDYTCPLNPAQEISKR
ncbi:site-2 protease family protein [Luteolibacter soli]|uniref:Site-2 protease family protein n=1 Tax=Luteolibacter soli TaxID=3135280 RepID=A0ABU9AVV2_9BACT